jgi:hypothetical protein
MAETCSVVSLHLCGDGGYYQPMFFSSCRCAQPKYRRWPRRTWLERHVFWRFDYYPWECVFCRKRLLRKSKGEPSQSDSAKV